MLTLNRMNMHTDFYFKMGRDVYFFLRSKFTLILTLSRIIYYLFFLGGGGWLKHRAIRLISIIHTQYARQAKWEASNKIFK